jgi:hypothetical protein
MGSHSEKDMAQSEPLNKCAAHRRAASLFAARASGFSALFFWITSREAPTIDRLKGLAEARFFLREAWS